MLIEERLSAEKHFNSVGDFCSGADSPLDNFITSDAFKYDSEKYGNTYIIKSSESNDIIGFYTLKASGIQMTGDEEFNSIPVVEIARIAIHHTLQGNGIGKYVFYTYILPKIREVSKLIAVKAIIAFVETEDEVAIGFYKSIGFERATEDVQKEIEDSFNADCDLYIVALDNVE